MLGWAFKAILGKVGGWALTKAWAITTADPVYICITLIILIKYYLLISGEVLEFPHLKKIYY